MINEAEDSLSTGVSVPSTAHTPAPKLEDFHAFRRLCCDLSRLQGDQDKVQAELDQVVRKPHVTRQQQPASLSSELYRRQLLKVARNNI